jgi:ATP-binding cassette, subfamily C, bacteriocin exporter
MNNKLTLKKELFYKFHTEQKSIAECGVACLESVFKVYGFEPSREILKKLTGTSSTGASLLGLSEASVKLGLNADGYEGTIDELKKLTNPSVLHVVINNNQLHYVVCYGFNGTRFIIGDPGRGIVELLPKELDLIWQTKRLLVFTGVVDEQKFNTNNSQRLNKRKIDIWKLVEADSKLIIISVLIGLVVSILSLSLAYFSRYLLDDLLINDGGESRFLAALFVLLATLLLRNILTFLREFLFLHQNKSLSNRMNGFFYKKLLNLSLAYYQSMRTGDLVTRLNDTVRIQNVINYIFNSLVIDGFLFIAIIVFVFLIAPWLSISFLVFSALFFFIAFFQTKKVVKAQRLVLESYALNESTYINALQGIDAIKSHNKEDLFSKFTNDVHSYFQNSLFRFGKFKNNLNLVYSISGSLIVTLTIFFSCQMYFQNLLPLGTLVALLQVSLIISSPITNISLANFKIQEAKVAFDRINEFVESQPEYEKERDLTQVTIEYFDSLSISHLYFKFPGTVKLIEDINLEVKRGDFIALVGNSGVGKSTLLKILQKFYDIPKGCIFVNDVEWNELSVQHWRKVIGVVPQEITLFNTSIAGNIAMCESISFTEIERFCIEFGLDDFFKSMLDGYNTIVGESGINLSGGQKQLVGIARALYKRPQLLMLDEATSFLDAGKQATIFSLLKKINSENGVTILYVTHDAKLVAHAKKYVIIENYTRL